MFIIRQPHISNIAFKFSKIKYIYWIKTKNFDYTKSHKSKHHLNHAKQKIPITLKNSDYAKSHKSKHHQNRAKQQIQTTLQQTKFHISQCIGQFLIFVWQSRNFHV
jgi:hypothetical protein